MQLLFLLGPNLWSMLSGCLLGGSLGMGMAKVSAGISAIPASSREAVNPIMRPEMEDFTPAEGSKAESGKAKGGKGRCLAFCGVDLLPFPNTPLLAAGVVTGNFTKRMYL
jgi:hypothetical protein